MKKASEVLPWWAFALLAFVAVEQLMEGGNSLLPFSSELGGMLKASWVQWEPELPYDAAPARNASQLGLQSPGLKVRGRVPLATAVTGTVASERLLQAMPSVNVSIPCVLTFISPCGENLTVGPDGLDIKFPLGGYHIPGTNSLKPAVEWTEALMTRYVFIIMVIGFAVMCCCTCCDSKKREHAQKHVKEIFAGKPPDDDDDDDDPADQAAKEQEKQDALDPKSKDFIAPGNIYRLLAVLHPGIMPMGKWLSIAFKAIVCAYMQVFLPYKIIHGTLEEWKMLGIKSPLWFLSNAGSFVSMMAALLSLCNMFAGKCAKSIMDGLGANYYILTHEAEGGGQQGRGGYTAMGPTIPSCCITFLEIFWCTLSMTLNILMSGMLQIAMFLKIATFTGMISEVAIVAVSLYFIFDLDDKVMEADPELRRKYRVAVAKQKTEKTSLVAKPLVIMASVAVTLLRLSVPIGLAGIALISWKSSMSGQVIGGDGITRK